MHLKFRIYDPPRRCFPRSGLAASITTLFIIFGATPFLFAFQMEKVIATAKAATVFIKTQQGSGTGFIFKIEGEHGYVITTTQLFKSGKNLSLSDPAKAPTVVINSGGAEEAEFQAEVISQSQLDEVAVLRFAANDRPLTSLPLAGVTYSYLETTPFVAIGFPFGKALSAKSNPAPTITSGNISSLRYHPQTKALHRIQLNSNLNPGNNGGPILSLDGQVIGMAASSVFATDISFAIPLVHLERVLAGTLGEFSFLSVEKDPQQPFEVVRFQLILADPFDRVEEVGFTELKSAPLESEKKPPFRPLPGVSKNFDLNGGLMDFRVKRALQGQAPAWYQFYVRRKGFSDREYYPPIFFSQESEAAPGNQKVPVPHAGLQPDLPGGEVLLPANLDPDIPSAFPEDWIDKLGQLLISPIHLALPASPGKILSAGGGRYLIFFFPSLNSIGILDLAVAKFTKFLHFRERYLFAAGGNHLLLYFPQKSRAETLNLTTFAKVNEGEIDLRGDAIGFLMGSHHSNRVIAFSNDKKSRQNFFDLLDAETYNVLPLWISDSIVFDRPMDLASINPNATEWISATGRFHFIGPNRLKKLGVRTSHIGQMTNQGFVMNQGGGVYSRDPIPLKSFGDPVYPSQSGNFYLMLTIPTNEVKTKLSVYACGNNQYLFDTGLDLDPLARTLRNEISGLPVSLIYFSEVGHYIAVLDVIKAEFQLHGFSMDSRLKKLGVDYLFISSNPPVTVLREEPFSYQILTISNSKTHSFQLLTSPQGMDVSPQGNVTWRPFSKEHFGDHDIKILVTGDKGTTATQSFTISVQ